MSACLWIASFPWACFQRTFNRGQPAFREHTTKVILLLETFQTTFDRCQSAFGDLSTKVSLLILGGRGCSWGACFIRKFLHRTQRIPPAHTIPYPSIHYPFVPYHNISRPNNTHPYFTLLAYPVGNTHPPMHWIVVHCTALQCDRLQSLLLSFVYHLKKGWFKYKFADRCKIKGFVQLKPFSASVIWVQFYMWCLQCCPCLGYWYVSCTPGMQLAILSFFARLSVWTDVYSVHIKSTT